ncbi:MAG TPA: ABC transporter permease [Blastocatellia bacterium]|nr:ABC transporter permease [Blastocatellia bacterium]
MENLIQDLRYAVRMLRKKPSFTIIVVLALAIGIGANTAIFSVVNAILLRPLPYRNFERISMIWMNNPKLGVAEDWHSYPNYVDFKEQNSVFEEIAAFNNRSFNLTGAGDPVRVVGVWGTASLFSVLGVEPAFGRVFTEEEQEPGRDMVVVLSHGLWQRRFGGDTGIIGQPISLNGVNRTVLGVMPASFSFPEKTTEFWIPLTVTPQRKQARYSISLKSVGRLKQGVTLAQAQEDMGAIAKRIDDQFFQSDYGINLVLLRDQETHKVKSALLVLLGAVGFVLLIACANVANLLLARAAMREKEVAIRLALGARRWRIVRQLLTESVLLGAIGGAVGLLLAIWGLSALIALAPAETPSLDQAQIDARVLAFTAGISLLTGLVFGLVPALQASKPDVNDSLKEGGRGSTGGAAGIRVRNLLVVSEIALSLVLLVGAGLLIRSFIRLQQFELGFNPDKLLTMRIQLPGSKYNDRKQVASFFQQLLERIEATPGVQSAGCISSIFLSDTPNSTNFSIEGRPVPVGAESIEVPLDAVSSNYFRVMGIPLLRGREFDDRDAIGTPRVAIINDTFAQRFFSGEDPIGKRYVYGTPGPNNDDWITIVGVVGDMRRTGFDRPVRPETFLPQSQDPDNALTIVARTTGDPASLAGALRSEVWAIDKEQSVYDVKTMDQTLGEMLSQRRFNMLLLGIFASVALVLAAVGIYGVMSYSVTQRTHEIGIRMAMGAQTRDVLNLVVRHGLLLAAIGIATGLSASLVLTRLMATLLYGVSATDPLTFVTIPLVLAGVALGACFVPARRATQVDPMIALRYE